MPTPAFMSLEGINQGLLTAGAFTEDSVGNIYVEGHEDEFIVQAFNHEITIPRDPQSGQPSGPRVHGAMTVTKVFDKSSPLLYNALSSGERLTSSVITWYRTSSMGTQEAYFKMSLEDAVIVNIRAYMPNCQDPAYGSFTHLEEVSLSYRKIIWEHLVAGTSGEDDWRAPKR